MAAIGPGFYVDESCVQDRQRARAERAKQSRAREARIRALKRDIQRAKQRLREYDHFLAELGQLERDRAEELKRLLEEAGKDVEKIRRMKREFFG